MSEQVITPTPGRVVWYYPSQDEINAKTFAYGDPTQPLAATVAYAWHDRMVNLSVIDQNGNQFRRTSVALVQPGDEPKRTSEGPFATWMPYQIGQAKAAADVGSVGEQTTGKFDLTDEQRAALVSDKDMAAMTALAHGMAAVEKAAIAKKGGKASGKVAT